MGQYLLLGVPKRGFGSHPCRAVSSSYQKMVHCHGNDIKVGLSPSEMVPATPSNGVDTPNIRPCGAELLPSSRAALQPPGPLRTGREGFPSPSPSPSNASLKETRHPKRQTLTT